MQPKHIVLVVCVMIAGTFGGLAVWLATHSEFRPAIQASEADRSSAIVENKRLEATADSIQAEPTQRGVQNATQSEQSRGQRRDLDSRTTEKEQPPKQLPASEVTVAQLPRDPSTTPRGEQSIPKEDQPTVGILSTIAPGLAWGLTPEEVIRVNGASPSEHDSGPAGTFMVYENSRLCGVSGQVGYTFMDSKLVMILFSTTPLPTFRETWDAYALLENRLSAYLGRPKSCYCLGGKVYESQGCPPPVKLSAKQDAEYMRRCNDINDTQLKQSTDWDSGATAAFVALNNMILGKCGVLVTLGPKTNVPNEALGAKQKTGPTNSPKTEHERHVQGACRLYGACSRLPERESESGHHLPGRWGLAWSEIARYVDLKRRDVARGTVQTEYGIEVRPGANPFIQPFTHVDSELCLREMMDYVKQFPRPFVESGKPMPLDTVLEEASQACSPEQIEWYQTMERDMSRQQRP